MRRDSGSVRMRIELKIEIDVDAYENNRPSGRFEANTSNTYGLHEERDFRLIPHPRLSVIHSLPFLSLHNFQ